ncbi:MAG: extracellular solute-binding protein [Planctomycetota bacterium]
MILRLAFVLLSLLLVTGCGDSDDTGKTTVTLYSSIDGPYLEPIVAAFENEHPDIDVTVVTDTEATKSVGLAERLRAEAARPRANVWWGNEPFYTVALARDGLLVPHEPTSADDIRPLFRDPENRWIGNGLRVRVLVHEPTDTPAGLADLATRGGFAARPTAGTTGGHVAALYVTLGEAAFDQLMHDWHNAGLRLVAGNSFVVREVANADAAIGLTDNDDVANAIARGMTVAMTVPDQNEGGLGTLAIPTTVGLVAGSENNAAAKLLADFLVSAKAEQMLTDAGFIAFSVRDDQTPLRVMEIDYAAVAEQMPEAIRRATAILEGRQP